MKRSLEVMVANVQRSLGNDSVPLHDILRELDASYKNLSSSYGWPWLYAEYDIHVPAGVVSASNSVAVENGSTTVTGTSTRFPYGVAGTWTITINGVGPLAIDSIDSATSLTLSLAWSGSTASDLEYTLTDGSVSYTHAGPVVTVTNGETLILSTEPIFTAGDNGWRIKIGSGIGEYILASATDSTTAYLVQEWAGSTASESLTLYKDAFEMPADYEPGSELVLINVEMRYKLAKVPRYTYERMLTSLRGLFSNLPQAYTDHEPDAPGDPMRIRFAPPINGPQRYRLVYKRRPPDWTSTDDTTSIPQGFDQVVELMAESAIRMKFGMPLVQETAMRAAGLLRMLRKSVSTGMNEYRSAQDWTADSSFSQGGLSILPMVY